MLKPAFEREPVFPGAVEVSRHRCGKSNCRCYEGQLHRTVRLAIRFKDGTAHRSLDDEGIRCFTPRTEAYRRLRSAQRAFGKWQQEVSALLDSIERARRSTEGLSKKDRRRPLR